MRPVPQWEELAVRCGALRNGAVISSATDTSAQRFAPYGGSRFGRGNPALQTRHTMYFIHISFLYVYI